MVLPHSRPVRRSSGYILSEAALRSRVCAETLLHAYKHIMPTISTIFVQSLPPKGIVHILDIGWTASLTRRLFLYRQYNIHSNAVSTGANF